ncbi:MAG: PadR family transcriptional regulator [Tissierellia bacterium]|nr:PadR family transcriptional regulator [Tissierellia bacterium]
MARDNLSSGALTETTLLVLLCLYNELHGYGIKLKIEEKTKGRVELGMGTLYGALANLEEKNWIKKASVDGRRVNYIITEEGKIQIDNEQVRLTNLLELVKEMKEVHNV